MTDTRTARPAGESSWALPLWTLAPLAAIRLTTELSTSWLVISWVLFSVSVLLVAAGWVTVFRHGVRTPGVWSMCIIVHLVLSWQLIALLLH
ncbi:hypothetical protein [Streptomyces sp. NPDC007020]|uniref:hypothetical protein n=1 Tax=Streptomyces sp. NPDC007020 TaxID=3154585 RepID=UPI0033C48949